jgi:hypothetical protein
MLAPLLSAKSQGGRTKGVELVLKKASNQVIALTLFHSLNSDWRDSKIRHSADLHASLAIYNNPPHPGAQSQFGNHRSGRKRGEKERIRGRMIPGQGVVNKKDLTQGTFYCSCDFVPQPEDL